MRASEGFGLFRKRVATVPFEALIAGLVVVSGVAGLFGIGDANVLDRLLPEWLFVSLQASYSLSGLLIIAGLGLARGNLEAAGLVLLVSAVVVRLIGLGLALGFLNENVLLLFTLYVMVIAAAGLRFWTIVRGEQIVRVDGHV